MDRTNKFRDKLVFLLLIILIVFLPFNDQLNGIVNANNEHFKTAAIDRDQLETYILEIINWKKSQMNQPDDSLLTNVFLENAGETSVDWYVLSLGRAGIPDDYAAYLAITKDIVEKRYETEEKLSNAKATEWHRISLAILAAGGDPTTFGKDEQNQPINLIADGTYDRGKDTRPLGAQGINGWIWGLIALDSLRYKVPDDVVETRDSMIEEILSAQLEDGGFSLNTYEQDATVDLTAMAIQALAPYYNSEETYTYKQIATDEKVTKNVRDVIDEAIQLLSEMQLDDGGYELADMSNVESTAQVIVALTAVGIDPLQDERFIKNGHTLLDAILAYRMSDGGYIHADTYDEENKTADPNESNSMASEQVLYTYIALYRFYNDSRSLYDFREEMSVETKEKIQAATHAIDAIPNEPNDGNSNQIRAAFATYEKVPITERSYVYNYWELAEAMEQVELDNTSEFITEHMGENESGNGNNINLFQPTDDQTTDNELTTKDKQKIAYLLEQDTSTKHYVDVVTSIEKLNDVDDKKEHKKLVADLESLKETIELQEEEINQLNQIILNELYPFNDISIDDQETVEEVMDRYGALDTYDQEKVQGYEDVEKAATQINNLIRARYLTIGVGIIIVGMSVLLVVRYKRRKKEKMEQKMMDVNE